MDTLDLSVPVATIGTSTNARLTFGPEEVSGGTACSTSVLVPGPGDTGAQCAKISRSGTYRTAVIVLTAERFGVLSPW